LHQANRFLRLREIDGFLVSETRQKIKSFLPGGEVGSAAFCELWVTEAGIA
jgi:hypothetical protein